jgi:outer membrane cobalamin receptor
VPAPRKLKDVFDLSIGAEYLVTNNFSIFGNLANVLNQKYDIYSRYQVPGFIVSAGLTYRF